MDGSQNQQTTGGTNLNQTQNPQLIPEQNLEPSNTGLQNSDSSLTESGHKITSVGSSRFTAVTGQNTARQNTASGASTMPLAVGLILGSLILAALLLLASKQDRSTYPKSIKPKTSKPAKKAKSKKSNK